MLYRGGLSECIIPICYSNDSTFFYFSIFLYVSGVLATTGAEKEEGCGFFLHVIFIVFIMICTFGYFVFRLLKEYTWPQIYSYLILNPRGVLVYAGALAIICWIMVLLCGFSVHLILSCEDRDKRNDACENTKEQSVAETVNDKEKLECVREKRDKRKPLIYIVAIVISLFILSCTIYKSGKDRIRLINKANIVSINGNTYYIAEENTEWAIVKECVLDEEKLVINENHYMLTILVDKNVIVKEIDNGLDDCMMKGNEYECLYGK